MRRWVFRFAAAVSLVLCLAIVNVWFDSVDFIDSGENLRVFWRETWRIGNSGYMIQSIDGRLWLLAYDPAAIDDADLWIYHPSGMGMWSGGPNGSYSLLGIPESVAARTYVPHDGRPNFGIAGFAINWTCASGVVPKGARGLVAIPYLPLAIVFLILPAAVFRDLLKWWRGRIFAARNCCPECSYPLTGNTSGTCPECGNSIPKGLRPA